MSSLIYNLSHKILKRKPEMKNTRRREKNNNKTLKKEKKEKKKKKEFIRGWFLLRKF